MSKQEPLGEVPGVNVGGSQGIVAGTGNVQNNIWMTKPPPDLASLSALSPHVAVARLRRMSYDDLVDLFARASQDDATEVLAAFVEVDAATAVAILGDIRRSKATELIKPLVATSNWLAELPEAAEAIGNCAVQMKWAGTGDSGQLERATESSEGVAGYRRTCRDGQIYWTAMRGALAISGAIAQYHETKGGTNKIGFPIESESRVQSSSGTVGSVQPFFFHSRLVAIYESEHGVYTIDAKILTRYAPDGIAGWLGFPVSEETQLSGADPRSMQRFEGGVIYSVESGTFAVRSAVFDYLAQWEGYRSYPLADEVDAEVSPYQTAGQMQRFEFFGPFDDGEEVVYSSDKYGINEVYGRPGKYYAQLGGTSSWLGFPKSDQFSPRVGLNAQEFEGGTVIWRLDEGPVAVPAATMELISRDDETKKVLGYPVSEELSVGADGFDRIQFFENGNVTVRNGKREIWQRPGSSAGSPVGP
jgi:hypothetical protein